MKICIKCNKDESEQEFKDNRNVCNECLTNYLINWKQENMEEVKGYILKWKENNVEKVKEYAAKWKKDNREKVNMTNREWSKKNPDYVRLKAAKRRALLKGVTVSLTKEEWAEIREEFKGKCFWCNDEATQLDHIVPLSPKPGGQQGSHVKNNVVPSCATCNSSKRNKDPLIFLFEKRGLII